MDMTEFLLARAAFTGIPFGGLRTATAGLMANCSWNSTFLSVARDLRHTARGLAGYGSEVSMGQAWRWAGCAYHCASLGFHLMPRKQQSFHRIGRLRTLARGAYDHYLRHDPRTRRVTFVAHGTEVVGYLREPRDTYSKAVVLFNGLDSLAEVEMHAFGDWMLQRGLAVLALDVPAAFALTPRQPLYAVERIAGATATWLRRATGVDDLRIGAFGVSFGGQLVARFLSGSPEIIAGVAVSPPAWIREKELAIDRFRTMLYWTFAAHDDTQFAELTAALDIRLLPPPSGSLRIYGMTDDQLFGPEHLQAYTTWAKGGSELKTLCAEHVGTTRIHEWLPDACDWLVNELDNKRKG